MAACLRSLFALAVGLCLIAVPALAESKLAFVIGIDAYPNLKPEAQLERAVADANAVGDALQRLGFQVTRVTQEATLGTILSAFGRFKAAIQPGDTVVFFYSGHGISLDDGNYLIPADIPQFGPYDEGIARHLALAEHDFSQTIRKAGARIAIMVIDACRNNPFPPSGTKSLGDAERGFKRLEESEGQLTLYSAREGQTALDRLGDNDPDRNSVFTRIFLKELQTPGVNVSELGDRVRDEVADLAQSGGHEQVPAVYNDLRGARTVFLAGPAPVAAIQSVVTALPAPVAAPQTVEPPAPAGISGSSPTTSTIGLASRPPNQAPPKDVDIFSDIVRHYFQFAGGSNDVFVDYLNKSYASTVKYYGKLKNRENIVKEKRIFLQRWPLRSYKLHDDSVRLQCEKVSKNCRATGLFDWLYKNTDHDVQSSGTASFDIIWNMATKSPEIIYESGAVVAR